MRTLGLFILCVVSVGCGSSGQPGFGDPGNSSSGSGNGGSSGSSSGAAGSSSGATSSGSGGGNGGSSSSSGAGGGFGSSSSGSTADGGSDCTGQAASFVYVLSSDDDLYSFAPDKKLFAMIGHLGCNTTMQPNSMAVDRNAVAWVNYVESGSRNADTAGVVYQVSTKDASCQPNPALNLTTGWFRLGMGYSTNGAGSTAETLYVSSNAATGTPLGLASVDLSAATLTPIGSFGGALAGQAAELTGTGDGRLFGYFTSSPVEVAQIDKGMGTAQTPVPMTGVSTPSDWAFSFWGGHFYLYSAPGQGNGSDVIDYDPGTGAIDTAFMTGIGFTIVGAGVSTCAPTVPPQ